jgi:arsenite methyltransferase
MSATLQFDEATWQRAEATYKTPDMVEQRRVVLAALGLKPGQDVLDIGSGPGFLAREMAEAVGPGGTVRGLDPSQAMLAVARRRPPACGSAPVEFGPGQATELPFADGEFDVVTSTQVYEYVDDMPTALAEAYRVLRPGGRVLVLDTDWESIVWRSSDADRMRRVLAAWDEHLADPHLPRRLTELLTRTGFTVTHRSAIPLFNAGVRSRQLQCGTDQRHRGLRPRTCRRDRCRSERLGRGSGRARRRILLQPQPLPLPRLQISGRAGAGRHAVPAGGPDHGRVARPRSGASPQPRGTRSAPGRSRAPGPIRGWLGTAQCHGLAARSAQ